MRSLVVFSCYAVGCLASIVAVWFFSEGLWGLAGSLVGGAISAFALGYICDSLGAIREALIPSNMSIVGAGIAPDDSGVAREDYKPKNNMRIENGHVVVEVAGVEHSFPSMEAAHKYLSGAATR